MHNKVMGNDLENIEIIYIYIEISFFLFVENLPNTSEIIPIGITSIATRQSAIANDIRK
jgi:hypothetical protein